MPVSIESIRAVILFAIGDPVFRVELAERPEEALAVFELSLDDRMLLNSVHFSETSVTFENSALLEQLLGAGGAGDGFPGSGAPSWFGPPADLGGFNPLGGPG